MFYAGLSIMWPLIPWFGCGAPHVNQDTPTPPAAPTLDTLLAEHLQALGGQAAVNGLKRLQEVSEATLDGRPVRRSRAWKAPGLYRSEEIYEGAARISIVGIDTAWLLVGVGGRPMQRPEFAFKHLRESEADLAGPLVDFHAKGHRLERLEQMQVQGRSVWRLSVTLQSGAKETIDLDAETRLMVRRQRQLLDRNKGRIDLEMLFADYRPVAGVMWPHTVTERRRDRALKYVVSLTEPNVTVSDEHFAPPKPEVYEFVRQNGPRTELWLDGPRDGDAGRWFDVTSCKQLDDIKWDSAWDHKTRAIQPQYVSAEDPRWRRVLPTPKAVVSANIDNGLCVGLQRRDPLRCLPAAVLNLYPMLLTTDAEQAELIYWNLSRSMAVVLEGSAASLDFGFSGYQWQGIEVLFDRATMSLWVPLEDQHLVAISGPRRGQRQPIAERPSVMTLGTWLKLHPETQVFIGSEMPGHIP